MKNIKILNIVGIISLIISFQTQVFAQATVAGPGNLGLSFDYLGWGSGMNIPLDIKNEDNQPLYFYTNSGPGTLNNRKMSIRNRMINGVDHAGVGIQSTGTTNITLPRSILHLGNNYFGSGIRGWRPWIDVGTFCGKGSDFAYFGTMEFHGDTTIIQGDHNDAVIVWGDNENPPDGADNLRFIFTAPLGLGGSGTAGTYNSLEVGRLTPMGRIGIGNFSDVVFGGGSGIQPVRKVEIYGENNDTLIHAPAPQLRLTFTPNANVNLGVNTDFESMSTGDLYIHPRSNGVNRFVGINTFAPTNTLEINSNNPYVAATIGNSGLVFTNLRAGNLTSAGIVKS